MIGIRNELIFGLGWKVADVEEMRIDEVVYWYEQAVIYRNNSKS